MAVTRKSVRMYRGDRPAELGTKEGKSYEDRVAGRTNESNKMVQRAILKRVPDAMIHGLPSSDQDAIRTMVGKSVMIVPASKKTFSSELEEVEFKVGDDIHTIWVDAADLEIVNDASSSHDY